MSALEGGSLAPMTLVRAFTLASSSRWSIIVVKSVLVGASAGLVWSRDRFAAVGSCRCC